MTNMVGRVKAALQKAGGATAAQVADALGVSKPTAYKYIKVLRNECGAAIVARRERVSPHGPKSKVYAMIDRRTK